MRRLLDILVATMVAALLAGGLWVLHTWREEQRTIDEVRENVRRIEQQVRVQASLGRVEINGRGWPTTIDPSWFTSDPPRNSLLTPNRPWMEIAPPEHTDLEHPMARVALDRSMAAFWYNPGRGIVRARVPVTISDRTATKLYNTVNGTSLGSIFDDLPNEREAVLALELEKNLEGEFEGGSGDEPLMGRSPLDDPLPFDPDDMDPTRPRDR